MRFLVDECTGPAVAAWLRDKTHDVFSVYEEARGMSDDEIIEKASAESWVLITNDKDFSEQVFRERKPHHGVVLLRLPDERSVSKISAIERLLNEFENELLNRFVVVTDKQIRFSQTDSKTIRKSGL